MKLVFNHQRRKKNEREGGLYLCARSLQFVDRSKEEDEPAGWFSLVRTTGVCLRVTQLDLPTKTPNEGTHGILERK